MSRHLATSSRLPGELGVVAFLAIIRIDTGSGRGYDRHPSMMSRGMSGAPGVAVVRPLR